ncbi:MAG: hypothetical protein SGJ00_02670 [bacterium]|nr:hypothetical protein [bacterium]
MRKLLALTTVLLFICSNLRAQKPSERRKIQQQKEATDLIQEESDGKVSDKNLTPSELRKKRLDQNEFEPILKEYESDFDINEAPQSYKKHSAVILAQTVFYEFVTTKEGGITEKRTVRRRLAIQDKSAVEAFSIFYTRSDAHYKITIIKPDNTKKEASKKAALSETSGNTEIPDFFFEFIGNSNSITKLPIQGLEIGDVLDIHQIVIINGALYENPFTRAPIVELLSNNYPLIKQRFGILVPANANIQLFSLNGAPKPEIESRTDGSRLYLISDSSRSTSNKEYYNYLLRSSPVFKFQLSQKSRVKVKNIVDNFDSPLSESDIIKLAKERTSPSIEYQATLAKSTIRYIKTQKIPPNSKEEIIRKAYYFLRTVTLIKLDNRESTLLLMYGSNLIKNGALESINEDLFLAVMKDVLEAFEIDYLNLAGVSRKYGGINDVIHQNELIKGIMVKAKNPIYILNPNQHSHFNSVYPLLQGTDVLAYTKSKNKNSIIQDITKERMPESSALENYVKETSTIKISENFENLLLQKQFEVKGSPRYDYYDNVLYERNFISTDLDKIGRKEEEIKEISKNKVKQAAYLKSKQEEKDKIQKQGLEEFKKMFENQKFDVENVSDFELISEGRFDNSPVLAFKINTEFKNLISQAGQNYLISIGALIGSQLALKSGDMNRNFDIYQNYRRAFMDELNFEIPEGYAVEDINALNFNVDNESASFVSKAAIVGNVLQIKTAKTYKKVYDPKEKWENYIKALDAAYEFQQKKIVLKKKA